MNAKKYKHLSFEDRCVIEEFLNHGYSFTQISNRLGKHRTAISKEVLKHRLLRGNASSQRTCCFLSKPPYVCNNCDKFNHCKKQKFSYFLISLSMSINKLLFLKGLILILLKNKSLLLMILFLL